MKSDNILFPGMELLHFKPKPGSLLIFPGFLEHEFSVDFGKEPLDLYIGIYKLCQKKWQKMFKVIDNLLDKDSFKRVHDMFYNNENFPWFSTPVLDYKEHKQFVHFFYYDHKP